jgi:hypothetical protein
MKRLFLKPIGTLRDLGTPSEWISDVFALAALTGAVLAALIFL